VFDRRILLGYKGSQKTFSEIEHATIKQEIMTAFESSINVLTSKGPNTAQAYLCLKMLRSLLPINFSTMQKLILHKFIPTLKESTKLSQKSKVCQEMSIIMFIIELQIVLHKILKPHVYERIYCNTLPKFCLKVHE
jgi:hypothetical protein